MALFKILEVLEPNDIIEQIPNADKALEWLSSNYGLIVNILTLIGLVFSVLYTFLKIKNVNSGITSVSKENKTNSKILYENQVESNKVVKEQIDTNNEVVKTNKDLIEQNDKLIKLIILSLQLAQIPLDAKTTFLNALNNLDELDIGNILKGFKTQVESVKQDIKQENDKLDEQIENLDRL